MTKYSELTTILDYIRFATSSFNEAGIYFGHGTNNAWDEAIALVLHSLHLPHDINPAVLNANLTKKEQSKLAELINLRITKRVPVPYLTHQAYFAGLSFYVDERVLIPRSPIAELILNHFEPWIEASDVHEILDLCTGSACIAIACAKAFPFAHVDAADISHDALVIAKINVLRHNLEEQISLHHSDLYQSLPHKQYDIIVSNPPYVSQAEMAELPPEYLHEPTLGLTAGTKGLDFITRIMKDARRYLKPHGILVVEVGNAEAALIETYPNVPFTWLEFEHGESPVFLLPAGEL